MHIILQRGMISLRSWKKR